MGADRIMSVKEKKQNIWITMIMFLLTIGELIADILAMAGIYCLGTVFCELLSSDIMAYLMVPVDVLLLILGIYVLQKLRKIVWSLCTKK